MTSFQIEHQCPQCGAPASLEETDRLFAALAAGGAVEMPLQEMFWGGYFGSLTDRFGIRWMFNCSSKT
jgi:PhnB protein